MISSPRVHYLVPTILVGAAFALATIFRKHRPIARLTRLGVAWAPIVVPRVLALTTFLAGTILLFSGATPAVGDRLGWLRDVLPLPVLELSHFFGSLAGVGLLILARGLQRRLDVAYGLTVGLLAAGILFSLLKAFDYEEALVLSLMLAALLPSQRYFYRRTSLTEEGFTKGWVLAIALVVITSVILGVLSLGPMDFSRELFWRFAFNQQFPRFFRATVGVACLLLVFAVTRLLRPARVAPPPASDEELALADAVITSVPDASAHLAFTRDKALLFNDPNTGFVMYAVAGRSWVSMGDPVASPDAVDVLITQFIELADRNGGWPVFYKIGRQFLHVYLDHGLSVVKLGEEARVNLESFSLEGGQRRNLRRAWRKAVEAGCTFELVPPGEIESVLPEMRVVSDRWLSEKKTREKGYSLGSFDDAYISRFPVGVARCNGQLVAFATVWPSGEHEELEVDLMRYTADAPPGIMRYVLVEFMNWGRCQGFRWFNLGMAPLSGLVRTSASPLWNQIGTAVFGLGERFYNFQGIREFKEWFYPAWEPRYLASPAGPARPMILANIATLVAGSVEGVVKK